MPAVFRRVRPGEYRLFLSHAWRYSADYRRAVSLLNSAPRFRWRNYSVPRHDPKIDPNSTAGRSALLSPLRRQVAPVHCVIVLSGMYAAHRYWIGRELDLADEHDKPIIAVLPWGSTRVPGVVSEIADEIVGRRTASIVAAVQRAYRDYWRQPGF
jgi:MTH538 TIR-like domain (DUF1863)